MSNKGPIGEKGWEGWQDLAPDICRQRIVIEGILHSPFTAEQMTSYCNDVTKVLNMTAVTAPVCNYDASYGWCAYMHWKESGMHIYAWDDRKPPFFSIDIYTCKPFDPLDAIRYTEQFFGEQLIKVTWKE
jgi:S-adenosylmethionine decarboxylase